MRGADIGQGTLFSVVSLESRVPAIQRSCRPRSPGLDIALFSYPGSRLASIGVMNLVRSQIGALEESTTLSFRKVLNRQGDSGSTRKRIRRF